MNFKNFSAALLAVALTAVSVGCETTKKISENDTTANLKNVSPKSIVFEWQPLYMDILSSFVTSSQYSAENSMFDLRDLNSDGTPELIVSPNTDHTTSCQIYTVYNGELVSLGEIGNYGTFSYLPQMGVINDDYVGQGFVIGKYLAIEKGGLVPVLTYSDNSSSAASGAVIKHEINDSEVSLPTYDAALEPYKNARLLNIGRKYSFGEEAADYALHCSESWGAVLSNGQKSLFRELLTQDLADSTASGSDAAFEICDLNNDNVPELIVSLGTNETDLCKIYYISGDTATVLDGDFGYKGRLSFDLQKLVFYALDSPSGNACWTLSNADLSNFIPSDSTMECGRKYILDEQFITASLR